MPSRQSESSRAPVGNSNEQSGSWVFLETIAAAVIAFFFFTVTARVLPPDQFGIAAITVSISQILLPMIGALFHDAVIQRDDLDKDDIQTAHSAALLWSVIVATTLVLLTPAVANVTNAPDLTHYLPWVAVSALATGMASVPSGLARRHMQHRTLAIRTIFGPSIATVVGLILLFRGWGAWSVVIQAVLGTVLSTIFLLVAARPSFRLVFNFSRLKPMLRFAGSSMGTQILLYSSGRIFILIFSAIYGSVAAATWSVALRFVEPLQTVAAATLNQFTLPIYARRQTDVAALRELFLTGSRRSSLILVPMFVGLGACSERVIETFVGSQWIEAAPMTAVICLVYAIISSRQLVEITLTSIGLPHFNLLIQLIAILLSLAGFMVGSNYGMLGATLGWSLRALPFVTIAALAMKSRAQVSLGDQARALGPIYAASGFMSLAVILVGQLVSGWPPLPALAVSVVTGVVAYFPAILILDRHARADLHLLLSKRGKSGSLRN